MEIWTYVKLHVRKDQRDTTLTVSRGVAVY